MNSRYFLAAVLCGLTLGSSACRKTTRTPATAAAKPVAVVAPELHSNGLGGLPGAIYQNQANSPIHWQPWTKATFERAKAAQRLVFCVIALPQYEFQKPLAALARDPAVVASIHQNYVPVLIDGDAAREMGLLTADLCSEIKRPLQLPMFVWMTYEANPMAWIPVNQMAPAKVVELFNQSHMTVSQMWNDDLQMMAKEQTPSYVLKNSASDNAHRRKRLSERKAAKVMSTQPAADVVRCLRQLASFYDPDSRNFDEVGGLFPAAALELLATAAVHPGLPADVRERSQATARELLTDLLASAMFDPLDGGVFAARRGTSWALPTFSRDCSGQARTAVALFQAYRATADPRLLQKALGLIAFAEKNFRTSEGLFAMGYAEESAPELWMWSVEDIEKELSPADAAWWIKATGMQRLGNLPSEVDPRREYFRCNTLSLGQSVAEIAATQSQSLESFAPRFDAARAKLLGVRTARLGNHPRDESSHAGATFRMVSAYAAAFGVTGDARYREQAAALLKHAQQAFVVNARLRMFSKSAPDSIGEGRAFLYGLALQAALDVAAVTSDEHWLFWAEDLATTAAELFTSHEFLKECPDDAKLVDVPVTDLVMLFDDSTAGLISMAECRLADLARPMVVSFSELATPMPLYALERPVLHTDLLLATLARQHKIIVLVGAGLAPELKLAIQRLPMRVIQRRGARPEEQVPAGSAKVILPGGASHMVKTPEELQEAVLPSSPK